MDGYWREGNGKEKEGKKEPKQKGGYKEKIIKKKKLKEKEEKENDKKGDMEAKRDLNLSFMAAGLGGGRGGGRRSVDAFSFAVEFWLIDGSVSVLLDLLLGCTRFDSRYQCYS